MLRSQLPSITLESKIILITAGITSCLKTSIHLGLNSYTFLEKDKLTLLIRSSIFTKLCLDSLKKLKLLYKLVKMESTSSTNLILCLFITDKKSSVS